METPSPPSVQVSQQLSQMTRWMEAQERCTHELSERVLAMDERSVQALGEISGQLARLEAALHTDINSRAGGVVLHHGAAAGEGCPSAILAVLADPRPPAAGAGAIGLLSAAARQGAVVGGVPPATVSMRHGRCSE
jgi:hypothetical protein